MEANNTPDKKLGAFSKLPREMRDAVYRSAFQGDGAGGRVRIFVTSSIDRDSQTVVDALSSANLAPFLGLFDASSDIQDEALTILVEQAVLCLDTVELDQLGGKLSMNRGLLERFKSFEATALFRIDHGPKTYTLGYLNLSLLTITIQKQAGEQPGETVWWVSSVNWRMVQGDEGYPVRPEPVDEARKEIEGVLNARLMHSRDSKQSSAATKAAFRAPTLTPELLEAVRECMVFSIDESLRAVLHSEYRHRPRQLAQEYFVQRTETPDGQDVLLEPAVFRSNALRPLTVQARVTHRFGWLTKDVELPIQ